MKELEHAIMIIVMLAALVIVVYIFTGTNLINFKNKYELRNPTFEITKASIKIDENRGYYRSGNYHIYPLKIEAGIKLSATPSEEITLVPVIRFKGIDAKGADIVIRAGENTAEYSDFITISTDIPPMTKMNPNSVVDMVEGQEYWYEKDGTVFIFKLLSVGQETEPIGISIVPEFLSPCKAHYVLECKNLLVKTSLEKCENDNPDIKCRDNLKLCGATVTITQKGDVDCNDRSAKNVEVLTEMYQNNAVPWGSFGESATIAFFRKSFCSDSVSTLEEMKECAYTEGEAPKIREVTFRISYVTGEPTFNTP